MHTHSNRVSILRHYSVRPPTQSCSCANSTHTCTHSCLLGACWVCVCLHVHVSVFVCIYILQVYVCKSECVLFLCVFVSVCKRSQPQQAGLTKSLMSPCGALLPPPFSYLDFIFFYCLFFILVTSVSSSSATTGGEADGWMDTEVEGRREMGLSVF